MLKKRLNRTSERSVEALEFALLDLLKKQPLAKIKISELCEAAKVTRPTVYAHFNDKDDVLAWHIARQLEPVAEALFSLQETAEAKNAVKVIETFFAIWQSFDEEYNLYQENNVLNLVEQHYLFLQREMYQRLDWLQQGMSEQDADLMFVYFTGALFAVLEYWMSDGRATSVSELTEKVVALMPSLRS